MSGRHRKDEGRSIRPRSKTRSELSSAPLKSRHPRRSGADTEDGRDPLGAPGSVRVAEQQRAAPGAVRTG